MRGMAAWEGRRDRWHSVSGKARKKDAERNGEREHKGDEWARNRAGAVES